MKNKWSDPEKLDKELRRISEKLGGRKAYKNICEYYFLFKTEFYKVFGKEGRPDEPEALKRAREFYSIDWEAGLHEDDPSDYWKKRYERAVADYEAYKYKYDAMYRSRIDNPEEFERVTNTMAATSRNAFTYAVNTIKGTEMSELERRIGERDHNKFSEAANDLLQI